MTKSKTVIFVFEAGCLRRGEIRDILRKLEFHNPGRVRWIEVKSWLVSEFTVDGDKDVVAILEKILAENEK